MTIHHPGWLEMQRKTGHLGEKSERGERLAMMRWFRRAPVGHASPTTGCWCEGDFTLSKK